MGKYRSIQTKLALELVIEFLNFKFIEMITQLTSTT